LTDLFVSPMEGQGIYEAYRQLSQELPETPPSKR
jgi:hypothetical protein